MMLRRSRATPRRAFDTRCRCLPMFARAAAAAAHCSMLRLALRTLRYLHGAIRCCCQRYDSCECLMRLRDACRVALCYSAAAKMPLPDAHVNHTTVLATLPLFYVAAVVYAAPHATPRLRFL